MSYRKWRLYIGPPYSRPSDSDHWDWSAISDGGSYTPASVATTLSATFSAGGATATVASTAAFPSAGGFWVGSSRISYVSYTGKTSTTFTGCTWSGDSEEQTTHSSGAPVVFWLDVSQNNGQLALSWELDSNLAAMQWAANIGGGVRIPQSAIRNNHAALVQTASSPGGSFTNYLLGWLRSPSFVENEAYRRSWTAQIVSSAQKVAEVEADGVRVGKLNIAADGSASAISSLAVPYKERFTGDYTAAEPDLSPASAIDEDESTLWISEDVIGTPLPTPNTTNTANDPTVELDMVISQVHIAPAVGESDGYQWIEITVLVDGTQPSVALWTDTEGYALAEIAGSYSVGDKIIVCADDVLFGQQNTRSSAKLVLSLEDNYPDFFSSLDPAGGAIGMYYTSLGGGSGWVHDVIWGTGGVPDRGASNPTDRYGADYTGGTVTAPTPGQTMRYTFANSSTPKNNWVTDFNDTAGYRYSYGDGYDEPWFLVELPSMGLMLAEDISSGFTGAVTIKDDSGDTTGGLSNGGDLLIGNDIITYSSKTDSTITIASGVDADHVAGDPIYVYYSSIASDGPPINEVSWSGASSYFEDFEIWYSRLPNARTPGTSGWQDDYVLLVAVTGHASDSYSHTFTTTRARKVVLLPTLMSTDPSRMRMREFKVFIDRTFYDTDLWLEDGSAATAMFTTLLQNAYVPSSAISVTDDGNHNMSDINTEKANAWAVVSDLADFTGHRVKVTKASKFVVTADSFWTGGSSYTPTVTWTRSNAESVRMLQDGTGLGVVSQIRLEWKSPDGTTEGTEVYPASDSKDWRGTATEIGPYIYADSTAAQAAARKQYYLRKYPYTLYVKPRTPGAYEPGQIHRVQWQFDGSWATTDRYYMVVSVNEEITDMQQTQSLNLIQVSRELPN